MAKKYSDLKNDGKNDGTSEAFSAMQSYLILIGLAANRQSITYGELAKKINVDNRRIGQILGRIQGWCEINHLPSLTVIAVNKEAGVPSSGNPNLQGEPRDRNREEVFGCPWFDLIVPTPQELVRYEDRKQKAAS